MPPRGDARIRPVFAAERQGRIAVLFPLDTVAILIYLELIATTREPVLGMARPVSTPGGGLLVLLLALCAYATSLACSRFVFRRVYGHAGGFRRSIAQGFDVAQRIAVALSTLLVLELTGLPFQAAETANAQGVSSKEMEFLILNFAGLAPYLLVSLAAWSGSYTLDAYLMPGTWTRTAHLIHKIRYSLFVLLLWLPLTLLLALVGFREAAFLDTIPAWVFWVASYGLLFVMVWCFPFFLRFFWGCRPLRDERLRAHIRSLERRSGTRFSQIYIWNLGGANLINAAAVGLFPPFRYLFLSRGLLDTMPPEELDAVIGHELGHARHRHLAFFLLVTVAVLGVFHVVLETFRLGVAEHFLLTLGSLIVYIRLVYGWCSLRFERQADLFAAELLGSPWPMIRALERIALLFGNIRTAPSWHHYSIAERVRFLMTIERHPDVGPTHHRRVRLLRRAGYFLAGLCFGILLYVHTQDPRPPHTRPLDSREARQSLHDHGQRLRRLLPDSPKGAHILFQYYADPVNPAHDPDKARRMAHEALRLAPNGQKRDYAWEFRDWLSGWDETDRRPKD